MIYLKIHAAVVILTIVMIFLAKEEALDRAIKKLRLFMLFIHIQLMIGLPISLLYFIIWGGK